MSEADEVRRFAVGRKDPLVEGTARVSCTLFISRYMKTYRKRPHGLQLTKKTKRKRVSSKDVAFHITFFSLLLVKLECIIDNLT